MTAKETRKKAWAALNNQWGNALLCFLLYAILIGAATFTIIGALLCGGPLTFGFQSFGLDVADGKKPSVTTIFDGFNRLTQSILLFIGNTIYTALWSLLFVIPGIIKMLSYSMSYYILKENPDMTSAEARRKSMEIMRGNKGRLFCLAFSFIGWILLSAFTFGILMLWVAPYMQVAVAEFYRGICPKKETAADAVVNVDMDGDVFPGHGKSSVFGNSAYAGSEVTAATDTAQARNFCPSCGAPIEPNAHFCTSCGTKID